jgi:hypothetical protein
MGPKNNWTKSRFRYCLDAVAEPLDLKVGTRSGRFTQVDFSDGIARSFLCSVH